MNTSEPPLMPDSPHFAYASLAASVVVIGVATVWLVARQRSSGSSDGAKPAAGGAVRKVKAEEVEEDADPSRPRLRLLYGTQTGERGSS